MPPISFVWKTRTSTPAPKKALPLHEDRGQQGDAQPGRREQHVLPRGLGRAVGVVDRTSSAETTVVTSIATHSSASPSTSGAASIDQANRFSPA
jgi:hypothetical protein